MTKADRMRAEAREARRFFAERGGSLGGYLAFYSKLQFETVKAIYEADRAYLAYLERRAS